MCKSAAWERAYSKKCRCWKVKVYTASGTVSSGFLQQSATSVSKATGALPMTFEGLGGGACVVSSDSRGSCNLAHQVRFFHGSCSFSLWFLLHLEHPKTLKEFEFAGFDNITYLLAGPGVYVRSCQFVGPGFWHGGRPGHGNVMNSSTTPLLET